MTTSGPEEPTRPNRAEQEGRTQPITTGPDAPTRLTGDGSPTRRLARAVRGALTDTRPLRTPAFRRL